MVWPTLGSRKAKEQNSQSRIVQKVPFSVTFGTGLEMLKNGLLPEGCSKLKCMSSTIGFEVTYTYLIGIERSPSIADFNKLSTTHSVRDNERISGLVTDDGNRRTSQLHCWPYSVTIGRRR